MTFPELRARTSSVLLMTNIPCLFVCLFACMLADTQTLTHAHIHSCTHTLMHTHIVCINMCVCGMNMRMCSHVCAYTYIPICVHICMYVCRGLKFMPGVLLDCSSSYNIKTRSLAEPRICPSQLLYLASLFKSFMSLSPEC